MLYLVFALVLWPLLVPFAVLLVEVVTARRKALAAFLAAGVVVGLSGLATVVRGPSAPHVHGSSIQYDMPSLTVIGLCLLATCGGALLSTHRLLKVMGAAALVLALVTMWFYVAVFISLWCFFSAVLTIVIFARFWSLRGSPQLARF